MLRAGGAAALLLGAAPLHLRAQGDAVAALRAGRVAAVYRHALAPGTFDPPGMVLADCSTQRNLNDEGREQARRLGAWFRSQGLAPAAVRSSPWCRCLETARLAFEVSGSPLRVASWPALGSPAGADDAQRAAQVRTLQAALVELAAPAAGGPATAARPFEVWVTHQFVVSALASVSLASGEGLVLRAGRGGAIEVVARLPAT